MTVAEALKRATDRLARAGVASPRLDARLLIADALGLAPERLLLDPGRALDAAACRRVTRRIARRAAREPVARIRGRREFWSLDLRLSPATLDPRPDSETLVETALASLPDDGRPARLLDLGTGTGCLLLAVLSERPAATGIGLDAAPGALAAARANAARLGLAGRARFRRGDWQRPDWTRGLGRFDLVLANPPYIATGDLAALEPELSFDPPAALDGGADGLDAYRRILPALPALLLPGGRAIVEIGSSQQAALRRLARAESIRVDKMVRDLAKKDRVMVLSLL